LDQREQRHVDHRDALAGRQTRSLKGIGPVLLGLIDATSNASGAAPFAWVGDWAVT